MLYGDANNLIAEIKKHRSDYRISYYDSQINIYVNDASMDALIELMEKLEAAGFTRVKNTIYER